MPVRRTRSRSQADLVATEQRPERGRQIGGWLAALVFAGKALNPVSGSLAWRSRRSGLAAGLALLVLVAGCVSQPEPTAAPSMLTDRERARVYARCMAGRGWDVAADESDPGNILLPDGGIPPSQSDAYERDSSQCNEEHGLNVFPPPTEAEAKMMYRHYVTTRTCLMKLGFTISEPPTEGTFIAGYLKEPSDFWNPYLEIPPEVGVAEFRDTERACPQNPIEVTG